MDLCGTLAPSLPILPRLPMLLATVADSDGIECMLVDFDLTLPVDLLEGADEPEVRVVLPLHALGCFIDWSCTPLLLALEIFREFVDSQRDKDLFIPESVLAGTLRDRL